MASKRVLASATTVAASSFSCSSARAAARLHTASISSARRTAQQAHLKRALPFSRQQRRWISDDNELRPSKAYDFAKVKDLLTSSSKDTKPLLIDVREPHEYAAGHIPTAINIPVQSQPDALFLSEEEFEDRFGFRKPSTGDEVVFYCKAGVRSRAAAQLAARGGYERIGEYAGSWMDWVGKGGEVGGGGEGKQ